MGSRGVTIGADKWKSDSTVSNIIFVCEYLLGMPIVSAIVVYVDAHKYISQFTAGPCIQGSTTKFDMKMHKDTYMFVTPKFISEYSGDLMSVETDLPFLQFVDYLRDLIDRKPIITAVETFDGDPAPAALVEGTNYALVGAFLRGPYGPDPSDANATEPVLEFVGANGTAKVTPGDIQDNVITFTVSGSVKQPLPIGIYASASDKQPYAATPGAYTIVKQPD